MNSSTEGHRVNIRPGVGILSVLKRVDYRPWFALAEFVDNSLQSYLEHQEQLEEVEENSKLRVRILVDSDDDGRIVVRDNAGGISKEEYPRAFRPAEIPPDTSGLNEFGMGMKSAACWFAPRWYVRTSALGDPVERKVYFDVDEIVEDNLEELEVDVQDAPPDSHFTEIVLLEPYKLPYGRTVAKIKEHLTDIYRVFTRRGLLELYYNEEPLSYEDPEILEAPHWNRLDGPAHTWRKEIDFDFGSGLSAKGFAALRATGNTRRAGFALFRRNRLVQGSGDEGYRPHHIFGSPNSYRYQRLFGELHLQGFDVSHTKNGIQWDENEEPFLELLKEMLDDEPRPLLNQAENWRPTTMEVQDGAEEAASNTAEAIKGDVPAALDGLEGAESEPDPPESLPEREFAAREQVEFIHEGQRWKVIVELSSDPAVGDWLEVSDGIVKDADQDDEVNAIGIRLALSHPFMMKYGGTRAEQIEPLLRVAAGLALAEKMARGGGVRFAGTIRRNLNDLLRNGLAS